MFTATSPDNSSLIDSGSFTTPTARTNVTTLLNPLVDQSYYTVWLAAEDMQVPPLQQSVATRVIWQQPYLIPPQMNASIANGSALTGNRYALSRSMLALPIGLLLLHPYLIPPQMTASIANGYGLTGNRYAMAAVGSVYRCLVTCDLSLVCLSG